jgi:hypothetical protein
LRDVGKWEYLDSETGEDSAFIGFRRDKLAEEVRKYHLPDFSNSKNPTTFERAFACLEKVCGLPSRRRRREGSLSLSG